MIEEWRVIEEWPDYAISNHGRVKLTAAHVQAIRSQGTNRTAWHDLAASFNVSKATIRDVATGRTWRHMPARRCLTDD